MAGAASPPVVGVDGIKGKRAMKRLVSTLVFCYIYIYITLDSLFSLVMSYESLTCGCF